jgi:hypothetical protein
MLGIGCHPIGYQLRSSWVSVTAQFEIPSSCICGYSPLRLEIGFCILALVAVHSLLSIDCTSPSLFVVDVICPSFQFDHKI